MRYKNKYHLSYCTNVHPGENWEETFKTLKSYVLPLKERVAAKVPLGIGLRLSQIAAQELLQRDHLEIFKKWLDDKDLYVYTMNGFPFGKFHRSRVKDDVHKPDWTTEERLDYTLNLFKILSHLLPGNLESGSISTSPVSYRLWEKNIKNKEKTIRVACHNFAILAEQLYQLKTKKNVTIHVDIEPEPDGLIESCAEALEFFQDALIPEAGKYLQEKLKVSFKDAKAIILDHIRVCFDICHSALLYEEPAKAIEALESEGIKIGKVQISSAIKVAIGADLAERKSSHSRLAAFAGSVYLHQVIGKKTDGSWERYPDLTPALQNFITTDAQEWRIHFHVPVFMENYIGISSTREQILKTFRHLAEKRFTDHLEIETYTWEVLPQEERLGLVDSLEKEFEWVMKNLH